MNKKFTFYSANYAWRLYATIGAITSASSIACVLSIFFAIPAMIALFSFLFFIIYSTFFVKIEFRENSIEYKSLFKRIRIQNNEIKSLMFEGCNTYQNLTSLDQVYDSDSYIIFKTDDSLIYKSLSILNPASRKFIAIQYRPKMDNILHQYIDMCK